MTARDYVVILAVLAFTLPSDANQNMGSPAETDAMASMSSRCISCSVNGQLHRGHSRFSYEEGCNRFRCTCHCDGSWECPSERTEDICGTDRSRERDAASRQSSSSSSSSSSTSNEAGSRRDCLKCKIGDKEYAGNSYFRHVQGCITYESCTCHCNGSWVCPSTKARNTCTDSSSSSASSSESSSSSESGRTSSSYRNSSSESREERRDGSSVSSSSESRSREEERRRLASEERGRVQGRRPQQCRNCTIDGRDIKGNTHFMLERGCQKFKYCLCYCNASWNCPEHLAERTCEDGEEEETTCRTCSVRNKFFEGNSAFEFTDGCIEYKNCACNCDGSWSCPDSGARNICGTETEDTEDSATMACRQCEVKGQSFPSNDYFDVTDGCIEYKNCICYCNGSWSCPSRGAKNICDGQPVDSERNAEIERNSELDRNAEIRRTAEIEREAAIRRAAENERNAEIRRAAENERNAEIRRAAEIERNAEIRRAAELERNAESRRAAESERIAESRRAAESERIAESRRTAELERIAESRRNAELERIAESRRTAELERIAESRRVAELERLAESRRVAELERNAEIRRTACRTCEVHGKTFAGNDFFLVRHGCVEFRDCFCHCNGTWTCPEDSSRNICARDTTPAPETTTTTRILPSACRTCQAYGSVFKGDDYFDVTNGCTSYRNCFCSCNGTWNCPGRYATNTCNSGDRSGREGTSSETSERQSGSRDVTVTSGQCLTCNAKNKIVRGNSRFELRDGCTEYRSCICRCDGSWQCQPQYARNICPEQNRTSATSEVSSSTCTQCRAKGKIVTGNTVFELIDGCTRFTSCRCNCDGSWQCFPQSAQNICLNNGTSGDDVCSMCKASNGQLYQPNTKFQFTENCVQFNCDCFCNGSWSCPAQQSRWACTDRCLQCKVDGRLIQNNTVFTHKTGCLEYTCDCFCNGSWSCPGNTVRNTCPIGVRNNCQKCSISTPEGKVEHEGESDFVLRQECLHYKCRCNCDGSYSCPGKDARNVCRGETIGGCRSCMVSDSEYHRGETNFTLKKDCTHFDCRCNCDGSWNCPSESARDVCLGEVPGGCRVCRVSETERYAANQVFDLRKGCINYKCRCNCDGGWSCPGEDARDVCKGEVPGGCRSCLISENEFYSGNTNFEMVKNCIHYKCRCNCDGSYNCPGKTARRVCKTGDSEPETTPACKTCRVSDSEQFNGNSNFILERGCARYECTCNCDGSWVCPQAKTRDICSGADQRRPLGTAQCKPCRIGSEMYPGNSQFKFTRRCHQIDCSCACSGQWTCDQKRSVNLCRARDQESNAAKSLISRASDVRTRQDFASSSQSSTRTAESGTSYMQTDIASQSAVNTREQDGRSNTESRSNCRPCVLDGRQFPPNEAFSVDRGCTRLRNCLCYCDGRWQCAEETNICEGNQRVSGSSTLNVQANAVPRREVLTSTSTGSRTAGKKSTVEVDSSAWVFVDGKDNTYVKSTDDRTGGGYAVKVDTRYSPARDSANSQLGQYEDKSSTTFTSSGLSPESSHSLGHQSYPEDGGSQLSVNDGQCQRCRFESNTYPAGAHFDMRRGCVVYKCVCMCSGLHRCRLTSNSECTSQEKEATCGNCIYNHMVFPGNMGFTVREGCVEKECKCECDGTYTCPSSTQIQGCSADMPSSVLTGFSNVYPVHTGLPQTGNPAVMPACTTCGTLGTSVLVYHQPFFPSAGEGGGFVLQPNLQDQGQGSNNGQCSGCLIDGTVRAGNSTFVFVKDCMEMNCYCACGGLYKCSGRQAANCNQGMGTATQNPQPECMTCLVRGTEYPANVRFSYREGCNEFQCTCNCAGRMMCNNQPANICPPSSRHERGRMVDPLTARDDAYAADQARAGETEPRMVGELRVSENAAGMMTAARETCYECEVHGVRYPGGSKFFLRDGCMQRVCDCNCDRSWSCSNDDMVDICKAEALDDGRGRGCKECRVDAEVFIPRQDFQLNRGCFQHNCHCYCNGTYVCPKEQLKNICGSSAAHASGASAASVGSAASVASAAPASGPALSLSASSVSVGNARTQPDPHPRGPAITIDSIPGCKVCTIDGQTVGKLSNFMRQVGCYESVCHCQCNGTASCPPHATVNICELPDKLPMEERKGCTVGRFTYYTRVFANVEDCKERTCVCRDDGTYTCKSSPHDRKVC